MALKVALEKPRGSDRQQAWQTTFDVGGIITFIYVHDSPSTPNSANEGDQARGHRFGP